METDLLKKLREDDSPASQVIGAVALWNAADYIQGNYQHTVEKSYEAWQEASKAVPAAIGVDEIADAMGAEKKASDTLALAQKGEGYAARLVNASLINLAAQYDKLCEETRNA